MPPTPALCFIKMVLLSASVSQVDGGIGQPLAEYPPGVFGKCCFDYVCKIPSSGLPRLNLEKGSEIHYIGSKLIIIWSDGT